MDAELVLLAATILVCAGLAWWIPVVLAGLPEPTPAPVLEVEPNRGPPAASTSLPPAPPKVAYRQLARTRWLRPIAMIVSASIGAIIAISVGWGVLWWLWIPLVPVGVALAFVDWHTTLLPTRIIAPAYLYCLAVITVGSVITQSWSLITAAMLGWAVFGGVFFVLWFVYPRGLGYGDVRLAGVLGLLLGPAGWGPLLTGMYSGFLLGGLIGGVMAGLKLVNRRRYPFGPFLLIGAVLGLVFGQTVAELLH